ncbi:MAG: heme exporter protein CcmD [Gemmatimonadetes bacterium]|nr:heme exporter protein CcmD [Gemmatimonadota bacterium]
MADSGNAFVYAAYGLTWAVLLGYLAWLARAHRAARQRLDTAERES